MNTYIREAYLQLPEVSRENIRRQFAGSPKMLLLLDFLAHAKQKSFSVHEAVAFIYPEENGTTSFNVLRNRFFKLRKKLAEAIESGVSENAGTAVVLLPLEEEYFRCRTLIQNNFFLTARQRLEQLISTCWERNIFELLPDALSQVIFCSAQLNMLDDNPRHYRELQEAAALLQALHRQRLYARQAQEAAMKQGFRQARKFVNKMQPAAKKYRKYPRFNLYYQFTAFTLGAGTFGSDFRVLPRHQKRVQEITRRHPEMPVAFYEAHSPELIRYMMATSEAMFAYRRSDAETCYQCMLEAWNIAAQVPGLRVRKSELHYSNRIAIEIASGRYHEALKTADDMLLFLKDQKDERNRLMGYAKTMLTYTFAFPKLKPANPGFLVQKVKELLRLLQKQKPKSLFYNEILLTLVVFLIQNDQLAEAATISATAAFSEALKEDDMLVHADLVVYAHQKKTALTAAAIRKKAESQYSKAQDINKSAAIKRALVLLDFLEKRKK